jgi:hypothetical protein
VSRQPISGPRDVEPGDRAPPPPDPLRVGRSSSRHEVVTAFEARRSTHGALMALSVSLVEEFSGQVPAGTVIGCIAQARERLLAAGVRAGLVVAVESMTRGRLERLAPGTASDTHAPVPDQPELASARDGF